MKVFLTGVSGFIGQRLAEHLLSLNSYQVIGCGRGANPSLPHGVQYHQISQWNSEELFLALEGVDVVVHCAGKAGAWGDYQDFYHANVELTEELLKVCKKAGVKRFINISSPSLFFQLKDQKDLKEDDIPKHFFDFYGETKYLGEKVVQKFHCDNFLTLSLRPRGVIGRGDNNWFPRILEMYDAGKLIKPGKGENLVDFTSVKNLVNFIEKLFHDGPEVYGEVYNVTNGSPVFLWEFIAKGLTLCGKRPKKLKSLTPFLLMFFARASEAWAKLLKRKEEPKLLPLKIGVASYTLTLNIDKAKEKAGYQVFETTEDAMEEFARWWSSR